MSLRDLRRAAYDREGGRCIVSGQPLGDRDSSDWHLHHRRPFGMGSTRRDDQNALPNVIAVAASAHRQIHAHPDRSRPLGLLLTKTEPNPAAVPVKTWRGWRFLTADGGYREVG